MLVAERDAERLGADVPTGAQHRVAEAEGLALADVMDAGEAGRFAHGASSTTYWMADLSTTGGISFGVALVADGKRVPSPAAGTTALRTGRRKLEISCANCLCSHTTWRRPVRDFECGCGYRR